VKLLIVVAVAFGCGQIVAPIEQADGPTDVYQRPGCLLIASNSSGLSFCWVAHSDPRKPPEIVLEPLETLEVRCRVAPCEAGAFDPAFAAAGHRQILWPAAVDFLPLVCRP